MERLRATELLLYFLRTCIYRCPPENMNFPEYENLLLGLAVICGS